MEAGHAPSADALRAVVADDSALVRRGVIRMLEEAHCAVVGEAGDPDGLLRIVERERPDVAVVDIRMPPTQTNEGVRAAGEIRRRFPQTGVLVLSQYLEERYAARVLDEAPAGVGYLLKDSIARVSDLALAARRVATGGTVVDPEVVAQILAARRARERLDVLSNSERAVLALVAEGLSNAAIAARLVVSTRTVETHIASILTKLDIADTRDVNRRVRIVLEFLAERPADG